MNGLQLPPWDLAGTRKPAAGCLHKQCLLLSSSGRLAGERSAGSTMSPASAGRVGGGFLRHVPSHSVACPVGLLHVGLLSAGWLLAPA